MKKTILYSLVVLLLIPGTASANGSMTLTIADDGLSFTITPVLGGHVVYWVTFCDGTSLSSVTWITPPASETIAVGKPISHVSAEEEDTYYAEASRNCVAIEAEPLFEPLFMMWLLTRGDEGCILVSETHPSVERQRALCFPASDPDWTADNAPCADFVYSNGKWSCDTFGFSRLPLHSKTGPNLMKVWQRHIAQQQE